MLPDALLDELDPDLLAQRWADSLRRPPTATHRALVALDGNVVVGFAAVAPSEDPDAAPVRDAELTVLAVRPEAVGHGHGSRLLAAVADTARADGFARLTTWVFAQDDVLRRFLQEAGWAPDGAHREMMLETSSPPGEAPSVHQIRLHTGVEAP
jgi:GNAT superfamily N-acetyltransferase